MNLFDTHQNNQSRNPRISFLLLSRKTSYIQSSLWSDKLLKENQFRYPTETDAAVFYSSTYHQIHRHHWEMAGHSEGSSQLGNSRRQTRSHQRRGPGW